MRAFASLVVALGLVVSSSADAKSQRPGKHPKSRDGKAGTAHKATPHKGNKNRAARISAVRARDRIEPRELVIGAPGQSIGAPWGGRLQHATQLPPGDGYYIRRPWRSFGTAPTIDFVAGAIDATREAFPDQHVLAIGDISVESGGAITQHRSHQSGRDVDIGLFYLEQPAGYPGSFIHADASNLDCAATFKLIESFLASTSEDGGVQVIFLDFDVQGLLYTWALDNAISERRLARIFQYPHGFGAPEGIVRHESNHDNHMHVRFRCPGDDAACQ